METRKAYLFKRYFAKKATEEEKRELMVWISIEKNEEEVKALMNKAWKEFGETGEVFTDEQSKAMLEKILPKEQDISVPKPSKVIRFNWVRAAAVAAVLILIATGGFLWYSSSTDRTKEVAVNNPSTQMKHDVAPGGNKAILTLANGKNIVLDSMHNGVLMQQGKTKVVKLNSGLLAYSKQEAAAGGSPSRSLKQVEVQYNTLSTPQGGQYQLVLPDGSKVWLNAASSIRFPTAFTKKERRVEITGEAYFEIVQNADKPFVVEISSFFSRVGNPEVRVLGTHFNINAYQDEPSVKTTLIEGEVKLMLPLPLGEGQEVRLKPGEQAVIKSNTNIINVFEGNIEEALAWKNGLFYFNGEDMATIMHKISRWYGVEVTYQNTIPDGHYSGIISRNTNLSQVLEILKLSGIEFKIERKQLVVIN